MFSPIARSVNRLSSKAWLKSTSFASLQTLDSESNTYTKRCLARSERFISTANCAGAATMETRRSQSAVESRVSIFEKAEDVKIDCVKQLENVDIYHLPLDEPDLQTNHVTEELPLSKWMISKKQKALKRYQAMEEKLLQRDPASYDLFRAVKEPLLELERCRASALVDLEACCSLIRHLGDVTDPSTAIVIGSPGAGILSSELVRRGANHLLLFECNPGLRAHLQKIHKNDNVFVSDQYLFGSIWRCKDTKHHLTSLLESDRFSRLKIIYSLTNPTQVREIVNIHTSNLFPFDRKQVEIYLIAQKEYGEKLAVNEDTAPAQRIKSLCAWRQFVNTELICTVPSDSFFPTFAPVGFGVKGNSKRDPHVAIIRCSFRNLNYHGRAMQAPERYAYFMFIRHCMAMSTSPVIHTLEKLTPGIGIDLIRKRVALFTRFNQLSEVQLLHVFTSFLDHMPVGSPIWSMMSGSQTNLKSTISSM